MPKKHPLRAPENIRSQAKALRKEMTPAEAVLWRHLRNRQLHGLKFRRQHPIGRFIVDFYCTKKHLVIEIDGGIHKTQQEYDTAREAYLRQRGYRVIRFHNREVLNNIGGVLESIQQAALATNAERCGITGER